jgi:hypothetical protein
LSSYRTATPVQRAIAHQRFERSLREKLERDTTSPGIRLSPEWSIEPKRLFPVGG